ncbi:MAG: sulfatase [Sedimentisphaeraceae bacterium JB056]
MDKPNIILITCHDIGQHLGCYGVDTVCTPAIDEFASQSVRFENSFCTAPQCSPSRASIYTGRYPHNNGVMGLTHFNFAWDLNPDEKHLNGYLQDAGYTTALIGVQHETRYPERIGYDFFKAAGVDASSGKFGEQDGYDGNPPCELIAEDSADYIKRHGDSQKPFYLQIGFFEPHRNFDFGGAKPDSSKGVFVPPYLVDEPSARDEFAEFQGAIKKVDTAIGNIFKAVDQAGLRDNTIVIYTADHGIPFPRAKCTLYDAGLQVPFIIRWPQRDWQGGRVQEEMISNIDYVPTLLDALGIDVPENVQGRSFTGLLDGSDYEPNQEIYGELTYHEYYDPMRCIRNAKYKLIADFSSAPLIMNPSQTYRPNTITVEPEEPSWAYNDYIQLYDLENDPYEQNNLADDKSFAEIKKELSKKLLKWMHDTDDPLLKGAVTSPHHFKAMDLLKS